MRSDQWIRDDQSVSDASSLIAHSPRPVDELASADLVTQPDMKALRRRDFVNVCGLLILLGMASYPLVMGATGLALWSPFLSGVLGIVVAIMAWRWQRDTWFGAEPVLIVRKDDIRIRHRGHYVWVPWCDIKDIEVDAGRGLSATPSLVFILREEACTRLPTGPVSLGDRLLTFHSEELHYSQPFQQPSFGVVAHTVHARWRTAVGVGTTQ
ncbi:MAG: hypothetical protein ACRCTR_08530 [Actinomycetota bacterium]